MLRFTDEIVLLAENKEGLEKVLNIMDIQQRVELELKINKNKTEVTKLKELKQQSLKQ